MLAVGVDRMNHQEVLDKAISLMRFYAAIDDDISRIIGLVQENQDFFGNPPAGQGTIKVAADWLEESISRWKQAVNEVRK